MKRQAHHLHYILLSGNALSEKNQTATAGKRKEMKKHFRFTGIFTMCMIAVSSQGCLRYLTHERSKAIVHGIDIDRSIAVARMELCRGGWGSVLTVWALRDQHVSVDQAQEISTLYFSFIDSLKRDFNIWHFTWAIADLYRLGNDSVKTVLERARFDASKRAAHLGGLADRFVNGDKLYMGDAHFLGRAYAHRHLVVPGNKRYLQSLRDYKKRRNGSCSVE